MPLRAARIATIIAVSGLAWGCASNEGTPPRVDSGAMDAAEGDASMMDGTVPGDGPAIDAGADSGPTTEARTCEACETHDDCVSGSFCVSLTVGGRACAPGCNPDIPSCPRAFNCVLDIGSGVDTTVCLPVGGACCVDEDADGYGLGVGCMGSDCNDLDENVNPGADELCNTVDDDCDGTADDPPTDCVSGRCSALGDGTYEAVEGADCAAGACAMGTTTMCGLFTCEDGGEAGNRCATACDGSGADDDLWCIDTAHCDGGGCVMDQPNGGACDEDSDCDSAHCDNGFCCTMGTCCSTTTDCPGGGAVTTICETPMDCQGSRGMTECTDNQCRTMSGIPDDRACTMMTLARDCGLYASVYCTGAADQPMPRCPTSCLADSECVAAAHCEYGFCVPDRPPGGACARNPDCASGLFCVDSVCCTSACTGTCSACNLAATRGTCTTIPAGGDPDGECPGFSCAAYFTGFGSGEDVCYSRQDVSDSTASCNGAGVCTTAATLCSLQPRGPVQIDCNNACQAPVAGTCMGMTAGSCRDLDNPMDTTACGMGACRRTVQRCVGGIPATCTPGTPTPETCNGVDDDCNGAVDNGDPLLLCPPAAHTSARACAGGSCTFTCDVSYYDLNGVYGDGCECADDSTANACAAATDLGAITTGASRVVSGTIVPNGEEDWYAVSFPATARGPAQGNPQIRLTGPLAGNFELDFLTTCTGTTAACGTGMALGVGSYSFLDDQSMGMTAYSTNSTPWPSTMLFRVRRVITTTSCSAAAYQVTITR